MSISINKSELLSAKYKPMIFCSVFLIAIGILMVVFGIIVLLIDHVELGPPHFDNEYERYSGSSLFHIVGPMFIIFGSFIILGNFMLLGFTTRAYYLNNDIVCKRRIIPIVKTTHQ